MGANPPNGSGVVTGQILCLQRLALPPTAVVTVTLADVSLADAPAREIDRQVIATPGQPPIPFELRYDPTTIIASHTYAVQARIEEGGRLMYISMSAYHVLIRGAPAKVEIWVELVGQPPDL
jgi:putative lipoprotein